MSREIGHFLGNLVGNVLEIDTISGGSYMGKYLRARVDVYIMKSLKKGLRVLMGELEEEVVVVLRYEHLPNFCYYCGVISYLVRECPCNVKGVVESQFRFGSWMRASNHFC
ncbi:hypothetical protein ACOSQ2_005400 [Xanthoceras sorbifolium]